MKSHVLMIAAATSLLLAGCASDMQTTTTATTTTTTTASTDDRGADVYYDGSYGAITNGYWGVDGAFYYRDASGAYQRDYDGHFLKSPGPGYTVLHVTHG